MGPEYTYWALEVKSSPIAGTQYLHNISCVWRLCKDANSAKAEAIDNHKFLKSLRTYFEKLNMMDDFQVRILIAVWWHSVTHCTAHFACLVVNALAMHHQRWQWLYNSGLTRPLQTNSSHATAHMGTFQIPQHTVTACSHLARDLQRFDHAGMQVHSRSVPLTWCMCSNFHIVHIWRQCVLQAPSLCN